MGAGERTTATHLMWEPEDMFLWLTVVLDSRLSGVGRTVPSRHGKIRPQVIGTDEGLARGHTATAARPHHETRPSPSPGLGSFVSLDEPLGPLPFLLSHPDQNTVMDAIIFQCGKKKYKFNKSEHCS